MRWKSLQLWFFSALLLWTTGYCPCSICCGKWSRLNGLSTNGTYAAANWTAACNPAWLGKVFWIPGKGVVKCEDMGSKVKKSIDIFFETHAEAVRWGRQKREVVEVTELFTRHTPP